MLKETIICIVIIIGIIFGNNMVQDYTREAVGELSDALLSLREKISQDAVENEKIKTEAENIYQQWREEYDKLAYFIEHNELEKIETQLTGIKSHIETEEYKDSISELDKSVFLLNHVEDKYAFNLQNVF